MAVRRGVSRAEWQRRLTSGEMCGEGVRFGQQFDTAGAAWKTCRQGGFMAWWLHHYYNIPTKVLQALNVLDADARPGTMWCLTSVSPDYADVLRATYGVDGTRKRATA